MGCSRLAFFAPVALITLAHCGSESTVPRTTDEEGATSSQTAASCAAQWDPLWRQGSGANNWWVEYAIQGGDVASAHLEVVGVADVPLTRRRSKWVGPARSRIPTGAWVVVHAMNALGEHAQTQVFGYLAEPNPLTACVAACVPSCRGRVCGGDGCGGTCGTCGATQTCVDGACYGGASEGPCWSPAWQQTNDANNWWAEYATTDLTVTSASLEVVGSRTIPLEFMWGAWVGPTAGRIATGAEVVLHASHGVAQTAHTKRFKYLVDQTPPVDCGSRQCTPRCAGRACGDDGCGGSCGACADGRTCGGGICVTESETSRAAVRIVGRYDDAEPERPKFGWPGARIIARFAGTAVDVTLGEESIYLGPSRWDVLVDGVRTTTLAPAHGVGTYSIAAGLPPAIHTIELYKRTEGAVGTTQFMGYAFPDGGKLLAPPPPSSRRIEFLGDSTTNGYGNECTSGAQSFSGATQNERLAFSGLVAHDLGADHHDISVSGKGVLVNYHRADTVVFDQLFVRTMPNDPTPLWAFSRFSPDVVWMNLGGNDWDQESLATPVPDLAAYIDKYTALVSLVRSKYPDAHLFCSITSSLNDAYPVGWNVLSKQRTAVNGIVDARVAAGDTKIYKYEFTRASHDADLTGCDYHTGLPLHRRMANEVIAQIRAKVGW